MSKLLIIADLWSGTLRAEEDPSTTFNDLDHARHFATEELKYDGISVRFGITKWQTSNLIRRLRREDARMLKAGLSRSDLAKFRKKEYLRKKSSQEK